MYIQQQCKFFHRTSAKGYHKFNNNYYSIIIKNVGIVFPQIKAYLKQTSMSSPTTYSHCARGRVAST